MGSPTRYLPDVLALSLVFLIHWRFRKWAEGHRWERWIRGATWMSLAWLVFAFSFATPHLGQYLPRWHWLAWVIGLGIAWGIALVGVFVAISFWRELRKYDPTRRRFLHVARAALFAAPFAATGFGVFIERNQFRVKQVDIPLPNLPKDLEGLRLVQLSDIHLSPFLSESELARAVDMANETKAHLALVTGDLITAGGDPLDVCLQQLARLKADAGIFGCLGNHEVYAGAEEYTARRGARLGIRFLRRQSQRLRFGRAALNLAGVDYQRMNKPYLVGAESLVVPGAVNVMLSHNPDVFPVSAAKGFDLTLSGHTHGGQVTVEILSQYLSVARFFTPYIYGMYREGRAVEYVTRGIGTVGVPARIGAPPEIALIRLVNANPQGTA